MKFINTEFLGASSRSSIFANHNSNIYYQVSKHEDFTLEELNQIADERLTACGWPGPKLFDEEGVRMSPLHSELLRYRQLLIPPGTHKRLIKSVLKSRRADGVYTPHYDPEFWDSVKY